MLFRASIFFQQCTRPVKTRIGFHHHNYLLKKYITPPKQDLFSNKFSRTNKFRQLSLTTKISGFALTVVSLKYYYHKNAICEPKKLSQSLKQDDHFNWKKLLYFIYLDIWKWLGAIAAALGVAYINIQLPISLGELANYITNLTHSSTASVISELNLPVGKLIFLYFAQALGTLLYISLLSKAGENLAFRLKYDLFEAILKQDMAFFDSTRTGELVDCLFADVQEFKSSFKQCVSQGLRNVLQICGCIVSLFNISPMMTISTLTIVPLVIVTGSLIGMILRKVSKATQEQAAKTFTMCEEVLSNIRTVRSFSNESLECEKFSENLDKTCTLNVSLGFGIGLFQAGTNLFLNGLIIGILYVGSQYVVTDNLTPGALMSFLVTAQMIQKSFAQLSLTFGHIFKGKQAFQRICYYTSLEPTIPTSGGLKIPYHSFVPTVEFEHVSFAYPTRPSQVVLDDINLLLPAGKTVAVVGSSGNGKSTMALLLERFYDVNAGSIKINGVDIRKLDPHWLRGTAIGIINQEPLLFATTIKENVKYGKPDATDEEIFEAAKLANADSFIRSFPDGYDTIVGERGIAISGGQKQRIAIARALIKKPSILILDEATSALDSESEKVVQEALEKVCKGRTVLVIAHRLSTVRNADIIAVINKGVILEMGSHEELMKKKGAYFNMISHQKEPRKTG